MLSKIDALRQGWWSQACCILLGWPTTQRRPIPARVAHEATRLVFARCPYRDLPYSPPEAPMMPPDVAAVRAAAKEMAQEEADHFGDEGGPWEYMVEHVLWAGKA